jgi:hypothetical protein
MRKEFVAAAEVDVAEGCVRDFDDGLVGFEREKCARKICAEEGSNRYQMI